jgi:tetratricopeptide (TPR) repeat protein
MLQYGEAASCFEQLMTENYWSHTFYTYFCAVCYDMQGEQDKAKEYYDKAVNVTGRKVNGKQLSVEQFVVRKVRQVQWLEEHGATVLGSETGPVDDAELKGKRSYLCGLEMIFLWNGFSCMSQEILQQCLVLAQDTQDYFEAIGANAPAAPSSPVDATRPVDERFHVLLLIKGTILRELGQDEAALECYRQVLFQHPENNALELDNDMDVQMWFKPTELRLFKEETGLIPYALYELSVVAWQLKMPKCALGLLDKAKTFANYNFEMR